MNTPTDSTVYGQQAGSEARQTGIELPDARPSSCVALGQLLGLSEPQFLQL